MIGLLRSELRRALSRRLVRALFALSALGILVVSITTFARSSEDPRRQFIDRNALNREHMECIEAAQPPPTIDPNHFDPTTVCPPPFEDGFVTRDTNFHLARVPGILKGLSVPFAIVAWLLAASLIGAEWRAGTITTTLTWEPRRTRLMAAKAAVAVVVAVGFTLALQAWLVLLLTPSGLLRGSTTGFSLGETIAVMVRVGLLAAVASSIGFALGSIGRNTAAALGIGFVYLAVVEGGLLGGIFPGLRSWLVVGNSVVLVTAEPTGDIAGRGVAGAAVLLLLYAAGALFAATSVFKARDVT